MKHRTLYRKKSVTLTGGLRYRIGWFGCVYVDVQIKTDDECVLWKKADQADFDDACSMQREHDKQRAK